MKKILLLITLILNILFASNAQGGPGPGLEGYNRLCEGNYQEFYDCLSRSTYENADSHGKIGLWEGGPESNIEIFVGDNIIYTLDDGFAPKYICEIDKNDKDKFIDVLIKRSTGSFSSNDLGFAECYLETEKTDIEVNLDDNGIDLNKYDIIEDQYNYKILSLDSKLYVYIKDISNKERIIELTGVSKEGIRFLNTPLTILNNNGIYKIDSYGASSGKLTSIDDNSTYNEIYSSDVTYIDSKGVKSIDYIDLESLTYFGNSYYKDKNNIYYDDMFYKFFLVKDVKINSFTLDVNNIDNKTGYINYDAEDIYNYYKEGKIKSKKETKVIKADNYILENKDKILLDKVLNSLDKKVVNKSSKIKANTYKKLRDQVNQLKTKYKDGRKARIIDYLYSNIDNKYKYYIKEYIISK